MKRLVVILVTAIVVVIAMAAPANAAVRYSSCEKLLKDYPRGIAKSASAATAAVKAGNQKPSVRTAIYQKNGGRLDRNDNGVMCEQSTSAKPATSPTPTPAPSSSVYWMSLGIPLADVWMRALIATEGLSQSQSNYMWAVGSSFQKDPSTYCPLFKTEFGKLLMMGTLTGSSLTRAGLDASYIPWATEQAPLVIAMVCGSYGL